MDIQKFLNSGIIEKYVLGLANREDMDRVEQMAKDYPEVNKHICKMQNCMEEYAEMHAVRPPKKLREKILSKIEDETIEPLASGKKQIVYRLPQVWKWGAGIAAMMILSLGAVSWMLYQNQKTANQDLSLLATQLKHLQSDQKALQTSNEQIHQKYSVLKDVTTKQVHLRGSQHAPQALAVVYWNPDHNKGYLNIVDLPKCPSGHGYQMWADVNGKHVNMGMLKPDENGTVLHTIPYINESRGFVITLEKEEGSDHPSTDKMYAVGNM